jgi:hypothetical protein
MTHEFPIPDSILAAISYPYAVISIAMPYFIPEPDTVQWVIGAMVGISALALNITKLVVTYKNRHKK